MKNFSLHTTNEVAQCLRLIREQGPILAITIADRLGLAGTRETKRRHVREIVHHLKYTCGEMIIGDLTAGYYIAGNDKEWQKDLDRQQIIAKQKLGVTHQQLKMVTDSRGQGLLFLPGIGTLNNAQFLRN